MVVCPLRVFVGNNNQTGLRSMYVLPPAREGIVSEFPKEKNLRRRREATYSAPATRYMCGILSSPCLYQSRRTVLSMGAPKRKEETKKKESQIEAGCHIHDPDVSCMSRM